jgi:hypothetical protein
LRERIRLAIEAPVGEAEKLLSELKDADSETRLSILISGWSRGLASALEELAIAVDELQQSGPRVEAETSPFTMSGEARRTMPAKPLRATNLQLLDLICDRERDLVLLDARVENLVIEERGRLGLEEDSGSAFFDYLVVLGGQRDDAQLEVRLCSCSLGDHP